MARKSPDDVLGFEFDWLATDGTGAVGLFSTAGGGYAPDAFLEDTEAHARAIGAILALPVMGRADCTRQLRPGFDDTWLRIAERGVYAFDSDPNGGVYWRIAAPHRPLQLAQLPVEVAEVAARIRFPNLRFAELHEAGDNLLRWK
jgi:hypothetical protein